MLRQAQRVASEMSVCPTSAIMRSVDIDQVKGFAGECAAKLGMRNPEVKPGRVPSWVPMGLRVRSRRHGATIVVGARFDELEPAEQDAMIAGVLALVATLPRYLWRVALVSVGYVMTAGIATGVTASFFGFWAASVPFMLFFVGWLLAVTVSTRWFCFTVDRIVAETFGWPVIDVALDFDRRNPPTKFSLLLMVAPNVEQRRARLSSHRTDGSSRSSQA